MTVYSVQSTPNLHGFSLRVGDALKQLISKWKKKPGLDHKVSNATLLQKECLPRQQDSSSAKSLHKEAVLRFCLARFAWGPIISIDLCLTAESGCGAQSCHLKCCSNFMFKKQFRSTIATQMDHFQMLLYELQFCPWGLKVSCCGHQDHSTPH